MLLCARSHTGATHSATHGRAVANTGANSIQGGTRLRAALEAPHSLLEGAARRCLAVNATNRCPRTPWQRKLPCASALPPCAQQWHGATTHITYHTRCATHRVPCECAAACSCFL